MDKLLKTAEVQALLNVGRDTVLKLIEDGNLKATRLGPKTIRVFQSSVDALIEEGLNS
jgi:excisionase family DNA binding protein